MIVVYADVIFVVIKDDVGGRRGGGHVQHNVPGSERFSVTQRRSR